MAEHARSNSTRCSPATARPWCWRISGSRLATARRCRSSAATASARRRCSRPSWATRHLHGGAHRAARQATSRKLATAPARQGRARLRAAGARDLSLADRCAKTWKSRRGRARGPSRRCSSCSRGSPSAQNNRGNQLSGGEQQMLAIGRALIGNPIGAADGRALRRPRAGDRRGTRARREAARRSRRPRP